MILLYNYINKLISNTDPLIRWLVIQVINSLKNQPQVSNDCVKQLISLTIDSNPYIRRLALISIINFLKFSDKNQNNLIEISELNSIIGKFISDPHPLIVGTAFYAITELKNRDYLNLGVAENFVKICSNLIKMDEFFLSRTVFSLVNFSKLFLFNNIEKNFKYIKIFFDTIYRNLKNTIDFSKNISYISAIYEIILEFEKQNFNLLLKQEFNIFKNKKRLIKLANIMIRIYQTSKNNPNENILILDLISKFINNNNLNKDIYEKTKNNNTFIFNTKNSEYFIEIANRFRYYISGGLFFIKICDKPFISAKKLEILVNLANQENIKIIFDQFKRNLNFPLLNIKKLIIKAIYFICKLNSSDNYQSLSNLNNKEDIKESSKDVIAHLCVEKLIDCLKIKDKEIISEVIISLRKLVNEIKEHTKYILIYCIKNFKNNISSDSARANIIWMVCQYMHLIPTVTTDFFRRILIDLDSENNEVKSQIINLAVKLHFSSDFIKTKFNQDQDFLIKKLQILINFCLEKLFYDQNYNIREKARLAQLIVSSNNEEYVNSFKYSLDSSNSFVNSYSKLNLIDFSQNIFKEKNNFKFFYESGNNQKEDSSTPIELNKEEKNSDNKRWEINSNFNLSLSFKMGIDNLDIDIKENEGVLSNPNHEKFENLYFFDHIEDYIDENFFNISLDDIINLRKGDEKLEKNNLKSDAYNNSNREITNIDKFISVQNQENNVKSTIENFDSKVNVEETRNKMKNQLDAFLNEDNDDEEEEFEVEINKD